MPGIALFGATGKMGRAILPLIGASDDLVLTGALASPGNREIGRDAGEVAGELGMSVGAVYKSKSRIMARLRQVIQQVGGEI